MSKKKYDNFHSQLALPFLETNRELLKELFETLELKFGLKKRSKQQFIDLGSGDGRVIIYAALNYEVKSIGVEINDNLVQEARENVRSLKRGVKGVKRNLRNIKIFKGDLFQQNLEKFDYVYIFSLPTIHQYLKHIFLTMNNNSILISHKYPLTQEIFHSFLKLEYSLKHDVERSEISTYFYSKIKTPYL